MIYVPAGKASNFLESIGSHKIFSLLLDQLNLLRPNHRKIRANQYLAHLAFVPALFLGSINWWLAALFMFYLMHGVGSGCGAHRYFTHRSFEASRWAEFLMATLFTVASSGSVIGYVLIHQKHHKNSDKEGDPHDPFHAGALKTWLGILDKKLLTIDPRAYMRLRSDILLRRLHDYYFFVIFIYVLSVSLLWGWHGFIFLYCIPVAVQFQANSALIVLCHTKKIGYRSFETSDQSRNLNFPFRLWLLGEELHNNHHYKPKSSTMNVAKKWNEVDPLSYLITYCLSKNKTPSAHRANA